MRADSSAWSSQVEKPLVGIFGGWGTVDSLSLKDEPHAHILNELENAGRKKQAYSLLFLPLTPLEFYKLKSKPNVSSFKLGNIIKGKKRQIIYQILALLTPAI